MAWKCFGSSVACGGGVFVARWLAGRRKRYQTSWRRIVMARRKISFGSWLGGYKWRIGLVGVGVMPFSSAMISRDDRRL